MDKTARNNCSCSSGRCRCSRLVIEVRRGRAAEYQNLTEGTGRFSAVAPHDSNPELVAPFYAFIFLVFGTSSRNREKNPLCTWRGLILGVCAGKLLCIL
ncbi:hypothetical protein JTE90_002341 [Oedothorax gibbosus]|uniref:Uncharacterized protein n=1 Tax=Oedothorax gibbosus TaxID=931172 RepID=A0AAV6ULC4_9ARAC|nr:hypothetical protein JTE90_002341 [Oedothorax gibbosus]